jgi:predicted nucleic acid-binding protein
VSYLLDTNILSETRRRNRNPGVTEWLSHTPADRLHVSVLTIGEIDRGIKRLAGRGEPRRAAELAGWLEDVAAEFRDRIVPVTLHIAREWGGLAMWKRFPAVDGLIAATARVHDWTVITRNVKDFAPTGARVLNPFS